MPDEDKNLYFEMSKRWSMDVEMPFRDPSGNKMVLPMYILSGREQYQAKVNAEKDTRSSYGKDLPKKDESSEWDNRFQDHYAYWVIYYSVRRSDDETKRFFPTKDAVMDAISTDEAGILSNHYMTVQLNQPYIIHLSNEEAKLEALLEEIIAAGKSSAFFLNSLTSLSQNILIDFLVAKLVKSRTANGSSTTPQDDMQND